MFSERLETTLANPTMASPSRLARLASSELANSETVSAVFSHITSQCRIRRSIDPLFRFVEAALAVFILSPHFRFISFFFVLLRMLILFV